MRLGGMNVLKLLLFSLVILLTVEGILPQKAQASPRVEVNIFYPGANSNISLLNNFENELGVNFTAAKWYQDWATGFDSAVARRFHDNGYIPELTWEPQLNGVGVAYDAVVNGTYDSYLNQTAALVRDLGFTIRISLAPEMNTDWTPWGIGQHGNNRDNHKLFWRHVVQKFRDAGANNVKWIWSANVRPWNAGQLYGNYGDIFPGSDYVDYMGLDGYNWGASQSWSEWQSFSEVFTGSYQELASVSSRDILIMEMASAEQGGSKSEWIIDMFRELEGGFSRIKGFTWFHINKETDWRISSSNDAKQGFINGYNGVFTQGGNTGTQGSGSQQSTSTGSTTTSKSKANSKPTTSSTPESTVASTATTPDPAATEYKVETAIEPKIAGTLIGADSMTRAFNSPEYVSMMAALLFGFILISLIFSRRLTLLRQREPITAFIGLGLVDSVYAAPAPRQPRQWQSFLR